MKCCGEDRQTPFCPLCGKNVGQNPLAELLSHVQTYAKKAKDAAEHKARHVPQDGIGDQHHGRRLREAARAKATARAKVTADRWQRWADALAAVLSATPGEK